MCSPVWVFSGSVQLFAFGGPFFLVFHGNIIGLDPPVFFLRHCHPNSEGGGPLCYMRPLLQGLEPFVKPVARSCRSKALYHTSFLGLLPRLDPSAFLFQLLLPLHEKQRPCALRWWRPVERRTGGSCTGTSCLQASSQLSFCNCQQR